MYSLPSHFELFGKRPASLISRRVKISNLTNLPRSQLRVAISCAVEAHRSDFSSMSFHVLIIPLGLRIHWSKLQRGWQPVRTKEGKIEL
jgi:hypothetical protein